MRHDDPADVLAELYETLQVELHKDPSPIGRARTITALWRAYLVMSQAGCLEVDQWIVDLDQGFRRLEQAVRKMLFKTLLSPTTSDADMEMIVEFLIEEAKAWVKTWPKDCARPKGMGDAGPGHA
jgi:hypothetical protein